MRLPSLLVVAAMMVSPTTTVPKKAAQPQYQNRFGRSSASSAFHRGASDGSAVRIESGEGGFSCPPGMVGGAERVRTRTSPARLMERDDQPGPGGMRTPHGAPRADCPRRLRPARLPPAPPRVA